MSEYPWPSYIELLPNPETKQSLVSEQLPELEDALNLRISEGLPVNCHILYNEQELQVFQKENPLFKQKSLPENAGPLRVVEIEGVEFNSCCGTHVSNLSQ